jgi:hypothetical protein
VRGSIVVAWLTLASHANAQDIAPLCEIRGRATLAHVHVTPGRSVEDVRVDARQIALTPLAHGLFHVRTLDEGRAIDGTTSDAIVIVTARRLVIGAASIAPGTRIDDVVIDGAQVQGDARLDDGVTLAHLALTCDALTIGPTEPTAEAHGDPPHGPSWVSRVPRLGVRTRPEPDGERVELRLADRSAVRLIEQARVHGWVRIEAHFAGGVLAGWVRDTDLALP